MSSDHAESSCAKQTELDALVKNSITFLRKRKVKNPAGMRVAQLS